MKTKEQILNSIIPESSRSYNYLTFNKKQILDIMQEYADQFKAKNIPEVATKKVLINTDIGLFNLSYLASKYYLELCGKECFFYRRDKSMQKWINISYNDIDANDKGDYSDVCISKVYQGDTIEFGKFNFDIVFFPGDLDCEREDENLIKTFETLGDKCNTEDCILKIIEIPNNIEYYIDQTDDFGEVIHEYHKQWWS